MTVVRVAIAAAVLTVVVVYAALSVRWTARDRAWYRSLARPGWQPPDAVFGVIWPLNFGALAVVGVVVALERPPLEGLRWLAVLTASVAPALGWAHAFYVDHALGRAAVLLAGATTLTWLLVLLTSGMVTWAGWALVPYAAWLSTATSLAVGYWRLAARPATGAGPGSRRGVHPGAGVERK